jgi:hypothetical protein
MFLVKSVKNNKEVVMITYKEYKKAQTFLLSIIGCIRLSGYEAYIKEE